LRHGDVGLGVREPAGPVEDDELERLDAGIDSAADGQLEPVITVHAEAHRTRGQLQESREFADEIIPAACGAGNTGFRIVQNVHGRRGCCVEVFAGRRDGGIIDRLFMQIDVAVNIVNKEPSTGLGVARFKGSPVAGSIIFPEMRASAGAAAVWGVLEFPCTIRILNPGTSYLPIQAGGQ